MNPFDFPAPPPKAAASNPFDDLLPKPVAVPVVAPAMPVAAPGPSAAELEAAARQAAVKASDAAFDASFFDKPKPAAPLSQPRATSALLDLSFTSPTAKPAQVETEPTFGDTFAFAGLQQPQTSPQANAPSVTAQAKPLSPRGALGASGSVTLAAPKTATRTLRRGQNQGRPALSSFDPPPPQQQQQQQQAPAVASSSPVAAAVPVSPVVAALPTALASPVAVPAQTAGIVLELASAEPAVSVRGVRRTSPVLARGDELAARLLVRNATLDANSLSHLVVQHSWRTPDGRTLPLGEGVVKRCAALMAGTVEVPVATGIGSETPGGPLTLVVLVTDPARGSVSWTTDVEVHDWAWGLRQVRVLVDGRQGCVPVVFPHQELALSALVTLPAGDTKMPEAFFDLRDATTGASVLAQPAPVVLRVHPKVAHAHVLFHSLSVARPGDYVGLLAVKHTSHEAILRFQMQFRVVTHLE